MSVKSFFKGKKCNLDISLERFKVPEKYILKSSNFRFDIVRPTDKKSSCFTK
ncbi:20274_t:CDS:2, partial [Entrophospora sp. SA101]